MDELVDADKNAVVENDTNFSDRLPVPGSWWFFLGNVVVAIILQVQLSVSIFFILPALVYSFGLFLPSLAAIVRRLHDTGRSGSNEYGPLPVS